MSIRVPSEFTDVSQVRPVPDNQEVFSHAETDRSVIVELVQQESGVSSSDALPARFHFGALCRDSGAIQARILESIELTTDVLSTLRAEDTNLHASVVYGAIMVSKYKDNEEYANQVIVSLACIRLPRVTTDVLVVYNDPIMLHPMSSSARLGSTVADPENTNVADRASLLNAVVGTLEVHDWSLFDAS